MAAFLVVPRVHVVAIWDMSAADAEPFWNELFQQVLCKMFDAGAKHLNLYAGFWQSTDHAHIWLMPEEPGSDREVKMTEFTDVLNHLRAAEGKDPFDVERLISHDRAIQEGDRQDVIHKWCAPTFDFRVLHTVKQILGRFQGRSRGHAILVDVAPAVSGDGHIMELSIRWEPKSNTDNDHWEALTLCELPRELKTILGPIDPLTGI